MENMIQRVYSFTTSFDPHTGRPVQPQQAEELTRDKQESDETPGSATFAELSENQQATDREERIRERAYRIWCDEGQPHGRDTEHWFRAQAEIDEEAALSIHHHDEHHDDGIPPYEPSGRFLEH